MIAKIGEGGMGEVYRALALADRPKERPEVDLEDWLKVKDSVRNFVYENFNPGLLPQDHPLRREIFENMVFDIGSLSGSRGRDRAFVP